MWLLKRQKIKNIIYKFIKMSLAEKILGFRILVVLGYVRFIMLYRNFENMGILLGCRRGTIKLNEISEDQEKYIIKVVRYVDRISRLTPWKSQCLVQAATKMHFLKKKKIHGTIYLGVKKEKETLLAHAWLMINDNCISGNEFRKEFTSVDFYTN
ncbi:MAG: lasso peptide biosynthesis B2 protein [Sarcina sp.]